MPLKPAEKAKGATSAALGFEAKLWLSDKLRNNMDAAEPSGANRVERDGLLNAARREHAAARGKQPAASSPKGERGDANQYFLTQFASAEGKNGGHSSGARKTAKGSPQGKRGGVHQFYTPSCGVRLLVEILAPNKGRIYDPACGSGVMLVQSEKFVESHGGQIGDISIYSASLAA